MEWGQILALVAAALAVILPGMGSSKGVGLSGETASGVSTETLYFFAEIFSDFGAARQSLPATYRYLSATAWFSVVSDISSLEKLLPNNISP